MSKIEEKLINARAFGGGITVASGFDLGAKAPLDSRIVVATLEERDSHVTNNRAYEGMLVYVQADKKTYQLVGTEWEEFGFNEEKFQAGIAPLVEKDTQQDTRLKTLEDLVIGGEGEGQGLGAVIEDVNKNKAEITKLQGDMSRVDGKIETAKEEAVAESKSYTDTRVANLVNSAPEALDTLRELADALGNDPNFAATVTTEIGKKADKTYVDSELSKKADATAVAQQLDTKADKTALEAEVARATAAEQGLANRLTTVEGKATDNATAIAEHATAIATNASGLAKEISDRKGEISRVEGLITAEKDRAEEAEATLQSNINTKVSISDFNAEQQRVNSALLEKASIEYVDEEIAELDREIKEVDGKVTANAAEIATLKTVKADKEQVATDISTAVSTGVNQAKSYTDAEISRVNGKISEMDSAYKAADVEVLSTAKAYADKKVADLVDGAPEALNTLKELANAMTEHETEYDALLTNVGKKADAATVNAELAKKANSADVAAMEESLQTEIEGKANKEHSHKAQKIEFENDQVTVEAIGGIKAGTSLQGMSVEEILSKLLFKHVNHSVSATSSPNGGVFEKGSTQTVTSITATVTKKSNPITKVEFLDGSNVLETKIEGVANGGTFTLSGLNIAVTANKNFTVKATANGENGQPLTLSANTGSFNFVYPYYMGLCADGVSITQDLVKGLTKKVEAKGNKTLTVNANNQRAVFAYPKSHGAIRQIFDPNNFDVTATFARHEISITGLDGTAQAYYVYVNNAFTASNFAFRFNY